MKNPPDRDVEGVSVVVPVRNGSQELPACLEALLRQTYPKERTEIIVVDDGSMDDTRKIAELYSEKGVRLESLSSTMGRIEARFRGAESARFERLVFIDSRVIADFDLLETFARFRDLPVIGRIRHLDGPTRLDQFFYRFKARYYTPYLEETFPAFTFSKPEDLKNRVPVGMGIFSCDKADFLRAIPKERGRYAHDDTALFEKMLEFTPIEKRSEPAATYLQRQEWGPAARHLVDRGRRFTSFYLTRRRALRAAYAGLLVGVSGLVVVSVVQPWLGLLLAALAAVWLMGACWYFLARDSAWECVPFSICAAAIGGAFLAGIVRARPLESLGWLLCPWLMLLT